MVNCSNEGSTAVAGTKPENLYKEAFAVFKVYFIHVLHHPGQHCVQTDTSILFNRDILACFFLLERDGLFVTLLLEKSSI